MVIELTPQERDALCELLEDVLAGGSPLSPRHSAILAVLRARLPLVEHRKEPSDLTLK
jgi:hypothetical protein